MVDLIIKLLFTSMAVTQSSPEHQTSTKTVSRFEELNEFGSSPPPLTDDERKKLTRIPDNVERDVLENLCLTFS